ncbi:T9SS type A sorting domain-containing protein [candidate division KSB1 bacterium]|nr:T9SS type A sorting domain-containing protein [candidate division KSB1 bacterium]
MHKKVISLVLFLVAFANISFAEIDTRLNFVSNFTDPTTLKGKLVFDVEIKGDGTAYNVRAIQNAFKLSEHLSAQLDTIYFTNQLFPNRDTDPSGEGYYTSETYNILDDSTWIYFIYQHGSGDFINIPPTEDWLRIVTISVMYNTAENAGKVDWFPDPMPPIWVIFTPASERIEGEELAISPELTGFTLNPQVVPVELASFSAESVDGEVNLQWVTASETNNAGFYVEYSDSEEGPFTRLNSQMIGGLGTDNNGRDYSFTDESGEVGEKRYYRLVDVDYNGNMMTHDVVSTTVTAPKEYALEQNFPNPFNPETTIKYKVKEAGIVNISIYNMAGQLVRTLVNRQMKPGSYDLVWNAKDNNGQHVSSGTYFYRMQANNFSKVQRMQLLR